MSYICSECIYNEIIGYIRDCYLIRKIACALKLMKVNLMKLIMNTYQKLLFLLQKIFNYMVGKLRKKLTKHSSKAALLEKK